MEQYQEQNNIRALIYGTLISADNLDYTEEQKQESMRRYGLATAGEKDWDNLDWEYILEPFESQNSKNKLIDLFK